MRAWLPILAAGNRIFTLQGVGTRSLATNTVCIMIGAVALDDHQQDCSWGIGLAYSSNHPVALAGHPTATPDPILHRLCFIETLLTFTYFPHFKLRMVSYAGIALIVGMPRV